MWFEYFELTVGIQVFVWMWGICIFEVVYYVYVNMLIKCFVV